MTATLNSILTNHTMDNGDRVTACVTPVYGQIASAAEAVITAVETMGDVFNPQMITLLKIDIKDLEGADAKFTGPLRNQITSNYIQNIFNEITGMDFSNHNFISFGSGNVLIEQNCHFNA